MVKNIPEGHIVQDFYIGNTHIKICDDYCKDKTPEQVQEILKRIAQQALPGIQRATN